MYSWDERILSTSAFQQENEFEQDSWNRLFCIMISETCQACSQNKSQLQHSFATLIYHTLFNPSLSESFSNQCCSISDRIVLHNKSYASTIKLSAKCQLVEPC